MNMLKRYCTLILVLTFAATAVAETCSTAGDMDPATRSAIESAARQYFQYAASGDSASLQQASISSVASNFGGIQRAVADNRQNFSAAQPSIYSTYLLEADGTAALERAEFFCGVFNSKDRLGFSIPNLPPGKYALVIQDANTPQGPYWLSLILQQDAGRWKLAGFYPKARRVGEHGPGWFLTQARSYRAKGETRNAYMYYVMARELALPVPFMTTRPVEKLDNEAQSVVPRDLPGENPTPLTAMNGKTFQLLQVFPVAVGNGLNLVVKYRALADVSNTRESFDNNMALIKAIVAKYPEYRNAFAGVVVRAVDPATGNDYGSLLPMQDIK